MDERAAVRRVTPPCTQGLKVAGSAAAQRGQDSSEGAEHIGSAGVVHGGLVRWLPGCLDLRDV